MLAPIALFCFNRPSHTLRTLEALARNKDFEASKLYIFCDGARRPEESAAVEATRRVARDWPHPVKVVREAAVNLGLARSVRGGVNSLCEEHGLVIVVEDDLGVSPHFLAFLNEGRRRYAEDSKVMQISGYMFPVQPKFEEDALFLPMTTSWGWATWQRAWAGQTGERALAGRVLGQLGARYRFDLDGAYPYAHMLANQLRGKNNSWAIWWYLHVFLQGGLGLFPGQSLVSNEGFDGSGTHCDPGAGGLDVLGVEAPSRLPDSVEVFPAHLRRIRHHLLAQRGAAHFVVDNWRRLVGVEAGLT